MTTALVGSCTSQKIRFPSRWKVPATMTPGMCAPGPRQPFHPYTTSGSCLAPVIWASGISRRPVKVHSLSRPSMLMTSLSVSTVMFAMVSPYRALCDRSGAAADDQRGYGQSAGKIEQAVGPHSDVNVAGAIYRQHD